MPKLNKIFLNEQKNILFEEKNKIENRLAGFAKESKIHEGEWTSNMPDFDKGTSLEEEADEVEEFGMRLALEQSMEGQLKAIDLALDKIKKGTYGVCDKCGKEIPQGRLKVYPQASFCQKCQ
ncbi:MAG: TraR/DksA family transcriptional regulator [Candidatus Pacebacteria bacterium]|nr:TraR/DksA family transcriptional regulator [Candidatus Paceibacterota bacterium]